MVSRYHIVIKVTIWVLFYMQVTFFVAFLALDARRETKKKIVTGDIELGVRGDRLPTISTVVVTPGVEPPIPVPADIPGEDDSQQPGYYSKWFGKGQYDPEAPTLGRR